MSRPVTAQMAVTICEQLGYQILTVGQIRQWANRNLIKKLGMDEHGAQRYDLVGILARVIADKAA